MWSAIACAWRFRIAGVEDDTADVAGEDREEPPERLARDRLGGSARAFDDDLARLRAMAAEVDDVRLVAEQRLLEVADPDRPLLADLEPVAVLRLAQGAVDGAHLLVEAERLGVDRVGRQEQDPDR